MSAEASGPPPLLARVLMIIVKLVSAFFFGLATAALITTIWWRLTPVNHLDVLVYDQTVPDDSYPEHAVLDQLLEYHRVPFRLGEDHVGAAPGGGEFGTWPTERPDLIFLADVYGVYLDQWGDLDEYGQHRATGEFTVEQAEDIERWVDAGTPAYGEFALITYPTPAEAALIFEDVFGFTGTGWAMTWVDDLKEVSPTIQSLGPSPWPYSGKGLLAVRVEVSGREIDQQLVVLTEDQVAGPPEIVGGPPGSIAGTAPFFRWFTVVEPDEDATVDAVFRLRTSPEGEAVLDDAGIPLEFPALVRSDHTMYFAGDGLDDTTPFRLRRLRGGAVLTRLVTGTEFRFVYMVLEPTVGWLIDQVPE